MNHNFTLTHKVYNNKSVVSSLTTRIPTVSLPTQEFNQVCAYRRAWISAIKEECRLTLCEPLVLTALVFHTDAYQGIGDPTLSALQKYLSKKLNLTLDVESISRILKRVANKGAIRAEVMYLRNKGKVIKRVKYTLLNFQHLNMRYTDHSSDNLTQDLNLKVKRNNKDLREDNCYKNDIQKADQEYVSYKALPKKQVKQQNKMVGKPAGLYAFSPNQVKTMALPCELRYCIEDKIKNKRHAEQLICVLTALKCPIHIKRKLLADFIGYYRDEAPGQIRNVPAAFMNSFKFYLQEIGDPLNSRNQHLKPSDLEEKEEPEETHRPQIPEEPKLSELTLEEKQNKIYTAKKLFELGFVPSEYVETIIQEVNLQCH